MTYLSKGLSASVISQVGSALGTFALALVVAHYLPKEIYGEYKYIISIGALLSTISLTGIGTAVAQSVARGYDGDLKKGFQMNLVWSAGFTLCAWILAGYYIVHNNTTLSLGMVSIGILTPFINSAGLYGSYLTGKKEFVLRAFWSDLAGNLLPSLFMLITVLITHNVIALVLIFCLANIGVDALFYIMTVKRIKPNEKTSPDMLSYAKHLSIMNIVSGISNNIDQVLLYHFVGPAQVAIYNFATAIPDQIKGPAKMLDDMIFVKFANRDIKSIKSTMNNKFFWIFLVSVVIVALYILCAPFIFRFLFPQYVSAVIYSQVFSLSILINALLPAQSFLSAHKKIREQYVVNILYAIFQIITIYLGIIYFGLWGVIVARVLSRYFYGFATYTYYRRLANTL